MRETIKPKYNITASIVLYNNDVQILKEAINSFLNTKLNIRLYLIDNSPTDKLRNIDSDSRIAYIFNNANLGYGKAHNKVLDKIRNNSEFHLILNPDIYFEKGTVEKIFDYMIKNPDIGLLMPKILNPSKEIQYLCKLLPSPSDLFFRRFLPGFIKKIFKKKLDNYKLKNKDYNAIMNIPNVSGCFLFVRNDILVKVSGFDERYFMYLEDVDLSRRIYSKSKVIYYPFIEVYHYHAKGSYFKFNLLIHHIKSAIKYFNKWGWINDKNRKTINKSILKNTN